MRVSRAILHTHPPVVVLLYAGQMLCTPAQAGVWVYATEKDALDAYNEVERQINDGSVPQGGAGIDTVAYMHGRCLLLGESGASIYGQVVRKDCV